MSDALATENAALRARIEELEGRSLAILNLLQDLDESNRALAETNAALARSNEQLDQFAAIASHDLQEPLRTISSFLGLISEHMAGRMDEKTLGWFAHVTGASARLKDMIAGLLKFSRTQRHVVTVETVSISELVNEVLDGLQLQLRDTGGEVTLTRPLPTVHADRSLLYQVVHNLVGNALKFHGDAAPRVVISAQTTEDADEITISDNGIGFEEAHAERIFGFFQRLHGVGKYQGCGIGLALCREIVRRHGGRMRVEAAPGEGAAFTFTLPHRR